MANFSERLKELRLENKLTQKQLANELNVSQTAIALWEKGKRQPDMQTLEQLAQLFEVNTDFLIGRSNDYTLKVTEYDPEDSTKRILAYCKAIQNFTKEEKEYNTSVFINYILKNNFSRNELEKLVEYAEFLKSRRGTRKSKDYSMDIFISSEYFKHLHADEPEQKKHIDDITQISDE